VAASARYTGCQWRATVIKYEESGFPLPCNTPKMNVASLLQGLDEAHIRYVLVGGFALRYMVFSARPTTSISHWRWMTTTFRALSKSP